MKMNHHMLPVFVHHESLLTDHSLPSLDPNLHNFKFHGWVDLRSTHDSFKHATKDLEGRLQKGWDPAPGTKHD